MIFIRKNSLIFFIKQHCVGIMIALGGAAAAQAADPLRHGNERTIFSFRLMNSGKYVSILESTSTQKPYIVYRFGTADKVELEFPTTKENSWSKFTYWYYLRGGGPENEGLDLNYLSFINNGWQYIVYDKYAAVGNYYDAGVLVVRLKDCTVTKLIGKPETRIGSLIDFRNNDSVSTNPDLPCQGQIDIY